MKKSLRLSGFVILIGILAAACAPTAAEPTMAATDDMHDATMADQPTSDSSMTEPASGSPPDWFSVEMTDVNTGKAFRISDFEGKVVLVETMAVWCPTCLSQQGQISKLIANLGNPSDLVVVSLDIDTGEDAQKLANHTQKNNLGWIFAVTPEQVINQIGDLYGAQFLNPPSAPMFIIDRHGNVHPLPFGVKSANGLQISLQPYLEET